MEAPSLDYIEAARLQGLRPGVTVCLINGQRLLMFYQKEYDLWQIPQGGIQQGESVDEALKREMTEELGAGIVARIQFPSAYVGENQVIFPPEKLTGETLDLADGQKITMQGKKYFFMAAELGSPEITSGETQFDDYKWADFLEALNTADTVYQRGKKRITIDAVHSLRRARWL